MKTPKKLYKTAVVIGKFYPPHLGHKFLIDTALENSEKVTVIVCGRSNQWIDPKLRYQWIKQIHPKARVILINDDELDDDDTEGWAKATINWLGYVPDACFTSEDYGDPWAKAMGCKHFLVDKKRATIPISGTIVRQNPLEALDFLHPIVRSYFVKRIAIIGAESTGTTTLAISLAKKYQTAWVPEFGRMYSEGKMTNLLTNWKTDEFDFIAKSQTDLENKLAQIANKVLILDTDAFATALWHHRYMGSYSRSIERFLNTHPKPDLYIVTGDEIPFVQDGTRDGEHIRHDMQKEFIRQLDLRKLPYVLVEGSPEQRLKIASRKINTIIKDNHEQKANAKIRPQSIRQAVSDR